MQLLFLLMFWSMAAQNLMSHLRYAKRYGLVSTLEPGSRNMRIRSCLNAPLKNASKNYSLTVSSSDASGAGCSASMTVSSAA